jgi:HSP20 family molecular chaperone IbpA
MTKLSFGAHPYLLGFEQLERLVERTAKSGAEGYPPYNIEAVAENAYRITLAVAGFREEDLSITVEDRQLVIRGRQADDAAERVFLHRGIAGRAFQRSFVLADGVEVAGAHRWSTGFCMSTCGAMCPKPWCRPSASAERRGKT